MSEWDSYAEGWDKKREVRDYSELAFNALNLHIAFDDCWKKARVLDFGCGTGLLTEKLAPLVKEVVAVDTSPKMVAILKQKNLENVTCVTETISRQATQSHRSFKDGFALIVASSVCGFLEAYPETLQLLVSTLVPSGQFVQWDWDANHVDGGVGLTEVGISNAFKLAKLSPVFVGEAFSMTGPNGDLPVLMGLGKKVN